MCGIVAVLNDGTYGLNTDDFFRDAMIASQVRGTDSTGIFQLNPKGDTELYKMPLNSSTFLNHLKAAEIVKNVPNSPLTIGHVRAATYGAVSTNNAHPFKSFRDDGSFIVGVHNGTLTNWKTRINGTLHDVDSAWAYDRIAEIGIEAFESFDGAYAFVWWDSRDPEHMFMARNEQRTLYYMLAEKKDSLLVASEVGMLGWVADRNNFKLAKDTSMYYLIPNKLYKFSLTDLGVYEMTDLPKHSYVAGFPATPSPTTALVPTGNSKYGLSDYDDEDNWNYHYFGNSRKDWYKNLAEDDLVEQENTITKIKVALARARNGSTSGPVDDDVFEYEESSVVDYDDLETAVAEAIRKQGEVARPETVPFSVLTPIESGDVYLVDVGDGGCTQAEKQHAKDLALYGMIVNFEGLYYEASGSVLYGQYTVYDSGMKQEYEAAMRFITSKMAHDLYMNNREPVPVAIVGTDDDVDTIFVAPLTAEQRAFLKETRAHEAVH